MTDPAQTAAPHLAALSIDGYGVLSEFELAGLTPGLNVVLGPNEAGKSTLFDFLTVVLFGFPSRRADGRYRAPVNGGRHGGRVALVDRAGDRWVVERHVSPARRLAVTRPDGSTADESDLRRLLGGASLELFRAVFAVDLDDLHQIEQLSSDEVREVLFSSSILGQRRSAAKAIKELEARCDDLVRPRQGGAANALLAALQEARRQLAHAREQAGRFSAVRDEAAALGSDVERLRERRRECASTLHDLERLASCWQIVVRRREAEAELAGLPELDEADERHLVAAGELSALRESLSGHRERVAALGSDEDRSASLAASIEERLIRLGAWAETVASDSAFSRTRVDEELAAATTELREATARRQAALRPLEEARGELATTRDAGPDEALPDEATLARRARELRQLRTMTVQIDDLSRQLAAGAAQLLEATDDGTAGTRAGAIALGVAAIAFIAIAVLAFARGDTAVGGAAIVAAGVAGAVAAGLFVAARRRSEAGSTDPATSGLAAAVAEWSAGVEAARTAATSLATALGIEPSSPVSVVESALTVAEDQLAHRRELDRASADRARVEARLHHCERELADADQEVERAEEAVEALARRVGLPLTRDPAALSTLVAEVAAVQERLAAHARLAPEVDARRREVDRYDASVRSLATRLAIPVAATGRLDPAEIERLLAAATERCDEAAGRAERRRSLEEVVGQARRDLEGLLGDGARAEALRARLETGATLDWESERAELSHELDDLERQHEATVERLADRSRELEELARSSDIPLIEQRCAALEEELAEVVQEYLLANGARLLLLRTLHRYEQERQPAVLERAGDHFCRVTGGRFVRLGIDQGPDGSKPSIRAFLANDVAVEAANLSRGTMEQLYLCLRLGLAESFAERYLPLPLVLDDVLVNFDPERCREVVRELAETASRHQVVLFTCHPALAETVLAEAPGTTLLELARR